MTWKRYQNELIALLALLLMFSAYSYKTVQVFTQTESMAESKRSIEEIKEVVALKKVWSDNKTSKNVDKLQTLIPASKVKWSNKSKKVTASYNG